VDETGVRNIKKEGVRMKKILYGLTVAIFSICCFNIPVFAQAKDPVQQEKDATIANIIALRNEEARVVVLQQLLNEEFAQLKQMQAVFCDQYNLDPEKFRNNLYRYDDKNGKFVEEKVESKEPEKATPKTVSKTKQKRKRR